MIELDLPNHWPEEKKEAFRKAFAEKMLKKLDPLIKQNKKDKEKEKPRK